MTGSDDGLFVHREQCPACAGERCEELLSVSYADPAMAWLESDPRFAAVGPGLREQAFALRCCRDCTLLFQRTVLSDRGVDRFYQRAGDQPGSAPYLDLRSRAHMAQEAILLRLMSPQREPRVLEFGAGWGRWAEIARAFGCDVRGIEVNEHARAWMADRAIPLVTLDDVAPASVDVLYSNQVMEHLRDPMAVLRGLVDRLVDGGLAYLAVPGSRTLLAKLERGVDPAAVADALSRREWDAIYPLEHIQLFSHAALMALAHAAGLDRHKPTIAQGFASAVLWDSGRQYNRNLLYPFKLRRDTGTSLWFRHGD